MTPQSGIIIGCPESLWNQWVTLLRSDPTVSFQRIVSDDFPDDPDSIAGGMAFARLVVRGNEVEVLAVRRKEYHEEVIEYPDCLVVLWSRPSKANKNADTCGAISTLLRIFEKCGGTLYLPSRDGKKRILQRVTTEEIERSF